MTTFSRFLLLLVLALPALGAPLVAAAAGTLCGTVRDGSSGAVIEGAGIFVFTTAGAFTGFEGVSDSAGEFCIPGIPAGTYDLQVRRDDYGTTHVRNVMVTDDVTGVEIGVAPPSAALLPPSPNPARERVTFRLRLDRAGPIRLEVFDPAGRRLKGWTAMLSGPGERSVEWDFRSTDGRVAPVGRYLVRLRYSTAGGPASITRSFSRVP